MSDYYYSIAKGLEGLPESTERARRAMYDVARRAMLAQLQALTPALDEPRIRREQLALEAAIEKVEAEATDQLRCPHFSPLQPTARTPGRWRKLTALTITALIVFATAALTAPEMMASLNRVPEGPTSRALQTAAGAMNKILEHMGVAPFASLNPNAETALQQVALYEEDEADLPGSPLVGRTASFLCVDGLPSELPRPCTPGKC
jgi:hypothetical protein